ncbi:MAG: response regulator [Bacteroidales bacterium]
MTEKNRGELKRVLVVDDEASMRKNICDILAPLGYETIEAADGDAALTMFSRYKTHVVILDINIPKKNGLTVLRELKVVSSDMLHE